MQGTSGQIFNNPSYVKYEKNIQKKKKNMEVMIVMNLNPVQQIFIKVPICAQNMKLAHTHKLLLVGLMRAHEFKSYQQFGWRKILEC